MTFTSGRGTDTGYLTARYRGRDPKLKPVVINPHMDVVEAVASDWERDPFTPVIENGYIYGRGAADDKGDLSMVVAALIDLKRQGWVPSRDVILGASGDEETLMRSTAKLAEALKNAELVLNADGGGGELANDFTPIDYSIQSGEKTYADLKLSVSDPGGHSSRPGKFNAIGAMARALAKVDAYKFPPQLSPLSKAYWLGTAAHAPADVAPAMRAFAVDPADQAAIDTALPRAPEYVGLVRTTCVPTMVNGGHAANALPASVTANVNCRIFPGTTRAQARDIIKGVIGGRADLGRADRRRLARIPREPAARRCDRGDHQGRARARPGPHGSPLDERRGERFDVFSARSASLPTASRRPSCGPTTISRTGSTSACRWRRSTRA